MTVVQKYHVDETLFGRQTLRFAVSDTYEDIFKTDIELGDGMLLTDVIQFEKVRQELELSDGKFAVDELTFSIDSASCLTENDRDAMYFCLDATDINVIRYCALYFGEVPSLDTVKFVGKIHTKISAEDKYWNGSDYSVAINPVREYKFSALSLDVSVLDECLFNGNVYDIDNVRIDNIRERLFTVTGYNWIKATFQHRIMYQEWGNTERYIHIRPLGNLKTLLDKILELSTDLVQEKYGIPLVLELTGSDLGIDVLPAYINAINTDHRGAEMMTFEQKDVKPYARRVRLKIADARTETTSPIYISQKMLDARLGDETLIEIDGDEVDFIPSARDIQSSQSMLTAMENTSEMLFTLARDLGCFLTLDYTNTTTINLRFVPRAAIIAESYTYLVDAESASLDTSSNRDSGGGTNYFGIAKAGVDEGIDTYHAYGNAKETVKYEAKTKEHERLQRKRNIDSKQLILSLSTTLVNLKQVGTLSNPYRMCIFHNTAARTVTALESWDKTNYEGIYIDGKKQYDYPEAMHSAIYVRTDRIEDITQPTNCYRPAIAIVATIDGKDKVYYTLGDYINDVYRTGQAYYETELQVTVPSWNGFNDSASATGASWNKLKLGSMFKFSEFVKRYDGEAFAELEIDRDYIVVGIETSLDKPETTLKLIDKNAYAFGYPAEIPELIDEAVPMSVDALEQDSEPQKYGYKIIDLDPPHEIARGEEVMILSDGTIAKAEADSSYKATGYGTALESGISGETIRIQTDGIVDMPDVYDFTGEITSLLFLRTNEVGSNVSLSPLVEKTVDEDLYCIIGVIDSKTSFKRLNKKWVML